MDRIHSFQNDGRTIIIVSHGLDQIAELCNRAVVLEHGEVQIDGEPTAALRHLRADFEVTRQSDRERERNSGIGQRASLAEVTEVRLGDDPVGQMTRIKPGGSLTIHVTVNAIEPLTDWMLGVGVDLPGGQVIYGTNTKLLGQPMPDVQGEAHFTVHFPEIWLGEGIYTVHAAIAKLSGVQIHRLAEAASIAVEAEGQSIGFLHARPEVTID
jgi:ABC-2 type transport system ATP-binding protein